MSTRPRLRGLLTVLLPPVLRGEHSMSRPVLLVTSLFYTALGMALMVMPVHAIPITRSTFEHFVHDQRLQSSLGAFLLLAGIASLVAVLWYTLHAIRIVAAALRVGSMSALFLLVLLSYLLLPTGSLVGVIIFGYLSLLSAMTLPAPIEPVHAAIVSLEATHQEIAESTRAKTTALAERIESLEASRDEHEHGNEHV